jgi:steroid 5-alpha reductase family enzyme
MPQPRRANHRASIAVLLGLVAVAVIPVGIELTRRIAGVALIEAAWGIPVALVAGAAALLFARGARGAFVRTLERSGGALRIRLGRVLAVAGICIGLSGSIAVGLYELLLRLEH